MLSTQKNILDFSILENGNTKTLVFVDESQYMDDYPDRPLLEVTPPGYNKYLLVNVIARSVNVFNSSLLKINPTLRVADLLDLQDGLWQFKYKVCPYDQVFVNKNYFRTTNINLKLQKLYHTLDLQDSYISNDPHLSRDLSYIYILLEGAKIQANSDTRKAFENYQLADRLIEKILNKFCKNCN